MFFKRSFLFSIILLLMFSIYNDITIGTSPFTENKLYIKKPVVPKKNEGEISIIEVRLQPGDTVLSVTEQINQQQETLDIAQVMNDFKEINPYIDPYHLEPDTSYFFPVY